MFLPPFACSSQVVIAELGHSRNDLQAGLRVFNAGKHLIFYTPTQEEILVRRILHGHRDIEAIFSEE